MLINNGANSPNPIALTKISCSAPPISEAETEDAFSGVATKIKQVIMNMIPITNFCSSCSPNTK